MSTFATHLTAGSCLLRLCSPLYLIRIASRKEAETEDFIWVRFRLYRAYHVNTSRLDKSFASVEIATLILALTPDWTVRIFVRENKNPIKRCIKAYNLQFTVLIWVQDEIFHQAIRIFTLRISFGLYCSLFFGLHRFSGTFLESAFCKIPSFSFFVTRKLGQCQFLLFGVFIEC